MGARMNDEADAVESRGGGVGSVPDADAETSLGDRGPASDATDQGAGEDRPQDDGRQAEPEAADPQDSGAGAVSRAGGTEANGAQPEPVGTGATNDLTAGRSDGSGTGSAASAAPGGGTGTETGTSGSLRSGTQEAGGLRAGIRYGTQEVCGMAAAAAAAASAAAADAVHPRAVGAHSGTGGTGESGQARPRAAADTDKKPTRRPPTLTRDTARPEGGGRAAPGDAPAPARQWPLLIVLALTGLGLAIVGTGAFADAFRVGTILIGVALITGAVLRRTLPSVGMLAVRSRFTDMVTYGLLGTLIVLLALVTQPEPWLDVPFLEDAVHFTVR
jgi:hypothetical protein